VNALSESSALSLLEDWDPLETGTTADGVGALLAEYVDPEAAGFD
jgi:hypothetical protein